MAGKVHWWRSWQSAESLDIQKANINKGEIQNAARGDLMQSRMPTD